MCVRKREREKGRKDEGTDEYFVTFTEKRNSNLPGYILRGKRVVSPFGLYANLLAISYMLCMQYCDKWVVLFRHPFSLISVYHVHIRVHTYEHMWIACFDRYLKANCIILFDLAQSNLAKYKLTIGLDLSWRIHFVLQHIIEITCTILLCKYCHNNIVMQISQS